MERSEQEPVSLLSLGPGLDQVRQLQLLRLTQIPVERVRATVPPEHERCTA